jgi:hypothetical protein
MRSQRVNKSSALMVLHRQEACPLAVTSANPAWERDHIPNILHA